MFSEIPPLPKRKRNLIMVAKEQGDEREKQFSLSQIRSETPSSYRQANFGGQRIDRYDERGPDSGRKGLSLLSSKVEGEPQGKGNLVGVENKKR
jgi:hypothetical protein